MRRNPEALQRSRARREKDERARRLREVAPELATLQLEIAEVPHDSDRDAVTYLRHIMVDRAPARFELPCHDTKCDGAHNITRLVLGALRHKDSGVEGRHRCGGSIKDVGCPYELHYTVVATYR